MSDTGSAPVRRVKPRGVQLGRVYTNVTEQTQTTYCYSILSSLSTQGFPNNGTDQCQRLKARPGAHVTRTGALPASDIAIQLVRNHWEDPVIPTMLLRCTNRSLSLSVPHNDRICASSRPLTNSSFIRIPYLVSS